MNDVFLQYGALGGVVLFAVMAIRVMFNANQKAVQRESDRADRLEEELRKLNEVIRTDYVQTISAATRAIADALAAVRKGGP